MADSRFLRVEARPPVVGTSAQRTDAVAKVTGAATYTVDVTLPDMLHARVVRADRAHARIVSVDKRAASQAPGVAVVIDGSDLSPLFARFGHIIPDHPILALDKVRYYGEPVALVVASDLALAADAAALVRVEYEDLAEALDPSAALAADAPTLHDSDYSTPPAGSASTSTAATTAGAGVDAPQRTPVSVVSSHPNIAHQAEKSWGDVDTALAEAFRVVETTVRHPMLYAYAMEPYNAVARFVDGALEVISTAQHPFMVAADLARVFSLPFSKVRVSAPYVGGGYGSKSYTKVEPLAAVGAWAAGRPVKLVLDVEESIYTTRADSAEITVRSGFAEDGTILVRDFDIVFDTGAYADNSPLVLDKAVNRCFGPYRVPNLRVRGKAVYTNTAPASSYRGFGAFQGNLAGEPNLDQAAEQLGIDPAELRRRNLVRRGERLLPKTRPMDADLLADLDLMIDQLGWDAAAQGAGPEAAAPSQAAAPDQAVGRLRGVGFGCAVSDAGAMPSSTAMVKVLGDGSVLLLTGSTEMGQGSRTVLAQIAAEELGVELDLIRVLQSDTATSPYERTTGASRTTTLAGLAVQRACQDAISRLRGIAAEIWDVPIEQVSATAGGLQEATVRREATVPEEATVPKPGGGRSLSYAQAVGAWFGPGGGEVIGHGVVRRAGELAELPPFWEVGMTGVVVDIDPDTGQISVDQLVTVADVGRAINPTLVEGQDLGAATQGLGAALGEQLIYDGPQIVNANLIEYRVPRMTDRPRRFSSVIAERGDGVGPYGAKGVGEGARNPIGGAVAAAVARAVGTWPRSLPLTPEHVWRLIREGNPQRSEP